MDSQNRDSLENKNDLELIKVIFKSPKTATSAIDSFKPAVIAGVLVVIFSIPVVNHFIESFGCQSVTVYAIKFISALIIFYILSRK
jgi:hypothetical protein